jgi:hypothetical protein
VIEIGAIGIEISVAGPVMVTMMINLSGVVREGPPWGSGRADGKAAALP